MSSPLLRFLQGEISQGDFDLPEHQERIRAMMAHNRANGAPVLCLCNPEHGPTKLSVVLMNESLFLRRYKDTDHLHVGDCCFSGEVPSAAANRTIPGIVGSDESGFQLHLDRDVFPSRAAVEIRDAEPKAIEPTGDEPQQARNSGSSRGAVTLLGVLRFLLETAHISVWRSPYSTGRSAAGVMGRVRAVASACSFGRKGCSLAQVIIWPRGEMPEYHLFKQLRETPPLSRRSHPELLVLGELISARTSSTGKTVALAVVGHQTRFRCGVATWEEWQTRFPLVLRFRPDGTPEHRIWLLMPVSEVRYGAGGSFIYATNIAPMLMSSHLIPCESGFEVTCAEYLVEQRRSFRKPMRFHQEDEMLPDFVLEDTAPSETHCEVWGLGTEEYLRRREKKKRRCVDLGIPLWEWDAKARQPLAPLPSLVTPY